MLAAIEMALQSAREVVIASRKHTPSGWQEQVRQTLNALLAFFDQNPDVARLLILRWPLADARAIKRRSQTLRELAAAIDKGREQARNGGTHISSLTAEALVGAAAALIGERLQSPPRRGAQLTELAGPLMSLIVLPYLGPGAARSELSRQAPVNGARPPVRSAASLPGEMKIRLTYRTLKVLSAIAENPRASNREIANAAGIVDQGQASKLLARLQRTGLIENSRRKAATKGEPNSWRLTAAGERLQSELPPMR